MQFTKLLLVVMATGPGCKSTAPVAAETTTAAQPSQQEPAKVEAVVQVLKNRLPEDISRGIFEQVFVVTNNDAKRAPLMTTNVSIDCWRQGVQHDCTMLSGTNSKSVTMLPSTKNYFWQLMQDAKLAEAPRSVLELSCSYAGPTTPPYDVEKFSCGYDEPHSATEVLLTGQLAEAVANGIRTDKPIPNGKTTELTGTLICNWLHGGNVEACLARAIENAAISENAKAVEHATPIALKLKTAYHRLEAGLAKASDSVEVRSVFARVRCQVDATTAEQTGARAFRCQLSL
jgi:hypothetical protein